MQIFELFGTILLKDTGVSKQLDDIDKKGSQTSKSMGLSFGSIAGAALKLGAVLGVGLGIKEMITSAAKGQETMAQMDAVLKSTNGSAGMTKTALVDLASSLSKTTTFSAGTTKAAENLLLTFTGISSKTFPDTMKAAQDMSTVMGTDLNSSVMLLGKSLNNPTEGMGRLTKSGVTFTAAQKEQITTMQKAGDTAGAQKIILAELSKEFGGSAEAAGKTFNGQVTILKNGLIGMGASIGSTVIPYLTQFITAVNTNMPKIKQVLTDVISAIVPKFQEWIKLIIQIAQELLPSFGTSLTGVKGKTDIFKTALNGITTVLTFLKDNIGLVKTGLAALGVVWLLHTGYIIACNTAMAAQKIAQAANILMNGTDATTTGISTVARIANTVATGAWNVVTTIATGITKGVVIAQEALNAAWLANPIGIVIALIVALVAGLVVLFENNKTFHDFVIASWTLIKQVVGDSVTAVVGFFTSLGTSASATWEGIKTGITDFLTAVGTFFSDSWNTIKTTTETVWNGIKDFFKTVWDGINTIFTTIVTTVITFVNDKFGWLEDGIKTIFNAVKDFFVTIWDAIKTVFLGVILLILDLVSGNFDKLQSDAVTLFNKLKDDFQQIWNDIKTVFTTVINLIAEFVRTTFTKIIDDAKTIWNAFKDFLTTLWTTIKTDVTTGWTNVKTEIAKLIKDIIDGAKTVWNAFKDFLVTFWTDLKTNATTGWNALKDAVITVCKDIIQGAKDIWNGLLDWFRELPGKLKTIGSDMFTSMKNGISSVIGTIKTTVVDGVTKAIDWLKALPGQALIWGSDFIQGFVDGITAKANALLKSVENIANSIRGMLHFSTPDYGPLADYETWMPDFMEGMAKGIDTNKFKVIDSIKGLTNDMKVNASVVGGITTKRENTSAVASDDKSKGDVYVIINSPTPVSPSEIARQVKRTQRELALQF
ncbi:MULTISPECIES: phage tail protein [Clostridium]|uniref:Phage tail length tape measure family protein n=1 Tax=Clostridium frigoriphilum TaxID=443253 RepID=A0ABU7UJ96_9CLOT|nr:phage tail length tape measure family protein [Clostridium sp. DSM 17811]MBU3098388.1 phage tail length tape measure family protein [Clostridium sp. DSM 17811]